LGKIVTTLRITRHLFEETIWNPLAICAIPFFIYDESQQDKPVLNRAELAVYAIACAHAEEPKNNCRVTLSISEFQELSGFSNKNTVRDALKGLEEKHFLRTVDGKSGEKKTREILNPRTGESFSIETSDRREFTRLRTALSQCGLGYFNIPVDMVNRLHEKSSSAFTLFVAVARSMNLASSRCMFIEDIREVEVPAKRLRKMTGFSHDTLKKSVIELDESWLHIGFTDADHKVVLISLIDPATKESLWLFEYKRREADNAERKEKFEANLLKREHTNTQLLAWAMWILNDSGPLGKDGEEFSFWCPVCRNQVTSKGRRQARPRFSVNVSKGSYGLWHCFDCGIGGTLLKLAEQRRGGTWDARKMLHDIEKEKPTLYAAAQRLLDGYKPGLPLHMMLK
jgi:hypothetical protein